MSEHPLIDQTLEIPDHIKAVKLEDLDELCTNTGALSGLWERSSRASDIREHQLHFAAQIEARAGHIAEKAKEVDLLRKEVETLEERHSASQEEWRRTEAKVLTATEPYSRKGIQREISRVIAELDDDTKRLESALLDGPASTEDPIALGKRYFQVRQQHHYNTTLLDSLI